MNKLGKVVMFLSSYSPLYILIITLNYGLSDIINSFNKLKEISCIDSKDIILYILIFLLVACNFILKIILKESNNYSETIKITGVCEGNNKIMDYILAYIVSFATTDFVNFKEGNRHVVVTVVLMQILLCYLYCKSNMLYINPVLNICFGYDIFIATTNRSNLIILTKNVDKVYLLKEQILKDGFKNIRLSCFSEGIYILK
ncbi:hypothetical protein [Clostridium massiliodielmoense]|uniref:hypothetical protein n=1 Tax=Clostridium massiliodielmoense TaxID=1776385 RepID=UPI000A26C2F0|nr:hypothetical protein [Clostridium massiliodielmoense]